MTILSILATISGIMMALANVPQAIKIYTRKSAKDVSITTFIMLTTGSIIWFLYGIEMNNLPIMLANGIGTLGCITNIIGWYLYK